MEIILIKDVKNLGYKDDVVKVKDGYGRNFLIPQGFAIEATSTNRKVLAENLKQRSFKEQKIRGEAEQLAATLKDFVVKIKAKAANTGKIYGSVNSIQLSDALKEQFNFDLDRKKIEINSDHVKEVGSYTAKVNLYKDIKSELRFEVIGEE